MTFFIRPDDPQLAGEVYESILPYVGEELLVSPRGEYDQTGEARVYGVDIRDDSFVRSYYRSGGLWDYVPIDQWVADHENGR